MTSVTVTGNFANERGRQSRALEKAQERGCAAVLVWGRGGGYADRHANLMYFAGYYPGFPTIPDEPDLWSDRGYGAILLTESNVILFADGPAALSDTAATHVVVGADLVSGVASQLHEHKLSRGRLAVIGSDTMTWRQASRLTSLCPGLELCDQDAIALTLRQRKDAGEVARLRTAARIGAQAVASAIDSASPGIASAEIAALAFSKVVAHEGCVLNFFADVYPKSQHGHRPRTRLPSYTSAPLTDGQVFTVDMSGVVDHYYFDIARSAPVGAGLRSAQLRLMDVSRAVVDGCVAALRPGARIGDAARAGLAILEDSGFNHGASGFAALGHGIGLGFEPPWITPDNDTIVEPGMCLCVEKRVTDGADGATFERMIIIEESGTADLGNPDDYRTGTCRAS